MKDIRESAPLAHPPQHFACGQVILQFREIFGGDLQRGFAPYYNFWILDTNLANVGHINFRVGDTEHIKLCAGHIGYEIAKRFQGNAYALQACRALAPFVASFYSSVIITADPDNLASIRTIERLGAVFIDEVLVPKHDPHFLRGSRSKRRYRWDVAAR